MNKWEKIGFALDVAIAVLAIIAFVIILLSVDRLIERFL